MGKPRLPLLERMKRTVAEDLKRDATMMPANRVAMRDLLLEAETEIRRLAEENASKQRAWDQAWERLRRANAEINRLEDVRDELTRQLDSSLAGWEKAVRNGEYAADIAQAALSGQRTVKAPLSDQEKAAAATAILDAQDDDVEGVEMVEVPPPPPGGQQAAR